MLRTGGDFSAEWVTALKAGLDLYLQDFRFVCLTDDPAVDPRWRVPLLHGFAGWWSKFELFRPGLFTGRVLYIDLDSIPVGDLSDLARYDGPFAMLSDFYAPQNPASGVMAWTAGEGDALYERFVADPRGIMRRHRTRSDPFYASVLGDVARLQDYAPGQIVSLKAHARAGTPDGARLVCFHGKPRPNDPAAGWAHVEWVSRARRKETGGTNGETGNRFDWRKLR